MALGLLVPTSFSYTKRSRKPLRRSDETIIQLDELLKKVWTTEANHSSGNDCSTPSPAAACIHYQASWSLAGAFNGKTVNELWRDIQSECKTRSIEDISSRGRELIFVEMTLEEFLVEARMYITNASIEPVMPLDSALTAHKFSSRMGFPPSPSIGELSDTPIGGNKRVCGDLDQAIERKLRTKNKNRESAARSRVRKQARFGSTLL